MELQQAIEQSINNFGIELLRESKIVGVLSDYNAFENMPYAKNMLKTIYHEGFGEIIYNAYLTKNLQDINNVVFQISDKYGFSEQKLVAMFCSFFGVSSNESEPEPVNNQEQYQNINRSNINVSAPQNYPNPYPPIINSPSGVYDDNIISRIRVRVKEIIVEKLGVDPLEVTDEASFTNDLGADDLDTVELIMSFEMAFNISIPDDSAEKIATVGDLIYYIYNQLQ